MPIPHGSPVAGVNRLTIEVVLPADGTDFPRVRLRVDGTDRLKHARKSGYQGFSAMELLVDATVLSPTEQPRRVALYECSCGIPGCGSLAPLVSAEGDNRIAWTDFRDFTGVFEGPLELTDPDDADPFSEGDIAHVPDLVFDRQQYEAEVARAMADRSWESDARRTDRLIAEAIRRGEVARLKEAVLALEGASATTAKGGKLSVTVDLHPTTHRPERGLHQQILLNVVVEFGSPEEVAGGVAARLRATPVDRWESTFGYNFGMRGHRRASKNG